jgi:ribonuclease R
MKKKYDKRTDEIIESSILSLEVLSIDDDGFSKAIIIDEKYLKQIVNIPFNNKNIKFSQKDHLLAQLNFVNEKFKVVKIIKKIEIEKSFFYAQVNLNSKNELILQELVRGRKSREIIIPIIPQGLFIKQGDVVKAQSASNQLLKKIKINKIKINKKSRINNVNTFNYAEIVEVVGSSFDPITYSLLAIKEHDLNYKFNDNTIEETKKLNPINSKKRIDLRTTNLVTIDGKNAKDFDDAVYAEKLEDTKGWRVIVAIADVSHYVQEGSSLDKEAKERGNSVYFPNLVIPMLPEKLSNNLCSLRPDLDRACLSVEIILDKNGIKKSHVFFQSIIKSAKRLTYEEVEEVITKKNEVSSFDKDISKVINNLYQVYKLLEKQREKRGALNLNLPEKIISFNEKGWPVNVDTVYGTTSNKIIEELMILANVAAAEEINKTTLSSVYRVHEPPSHEKYKILIDLIGKPLSNILIGKVPHPSLMNKILDQTKGTPEQEMINQSILRSQSQARYDNKNSSHFGLSLKNYVHFTSPIRRYADLLIHRQIIKIINNNKNMNLKDTKNDADEELKLLCEHISNTERKSTSAERKTIDRLIALLYQNRIDEVLEGTIISIHKFGIFVSMDNGMAEALLPIRGLPHDWYNYDEKEQTLNGENSGYFFKSGMELSVKITEVTPLTGSITVKWYSGGSQSIIKNKRRRRRR